MEKSNKEQNEILEINHSEIIDGLGYLIHYKYYQPFETYCGICDERIFVKASTQKYLTEIRKVPVKMLNRGALYCQSCAKRRARINYLKNGNKFIEIENGKAELTSLKQKEQQLKNNSKNLFNLGKWPY